jgi:hypothetical protein
MAWPIRLTWSWGAWPTRLIRARTAMRAPPRSASDTLQGDGGHVTAGEDIARRGREHAGVVLPGCDPGEESGQGDPIGGEGIRG